MKEDNFNLKSLKNIDIPKDAKKKLRHFAREWIKWEKQHVKEFHDVDKDSGFHAGSISIMETFFNLYKKNGKKKK